MIRVETKGSMWIIDDDLGRYMRMPKEEQPRPDHWSQGALEDLTWHDMKSWRLVHDLTGVASGWRFSPNGIPWLRIERTRGEPVWAPNAEVR